MLENKINNLPISFAGKLLGAFIPKRRKRIIKKNMDIVFGEQLTEQQKKQLTLAFYSHLAKSIREYIQFKFTPKKMLLNQFEVIGEQHLIAAAEKGRGVLILAGHLGNFEASIMVLMAKLEAYKSQIFCIRRDIKNKKIRDFLFSNSQRFGLKVISANGALTTAYKALTKQQAVIFTLDQHIDVEKKSSIKIDFFGRPSGTYKSLAAFSYLAQTAVIPITLYRSQHGKSIIEFLPEIETVNSSSKTEFIHQNTLLYNQTLEKMILQHPEQWYCWLHDRWKL